MFGAIKVKSLVKGLQGTPKRKGRAREKWERLLYKVKEKLVIGSRAGRHRTDSNRSDFVNERPCALAMAQRPRHHLWGLAFRVCGLGVRVWDWASSASATLKWGPKASPASATTFGGLGSLATECYVYFVLSPAGAGLILLLVCNQNIRFVFCDFRR